MNVTTNETTNETQRTDKQAWDESQERIADAISWLTRNPETVFHAALLLRLKRRPSLQVEYMAVDGVNLFWNPHWVCEQPMSIIKGVLIHEAQHIALLHPYRRQGRAPREWNYACDYAVHGLMLPARTRTWTVEAARINDLEVDTVVDGATLPNFILYDHELRDKSVGEIFHGLFDGEGRIELPQLTMKGKSLGQAMGQGGGTGGGEADGSDTSDKNDETKSGDAGNGDAQDREGEGQGNDTQAAQGNAGNGEQGSTGNGNGSQSGPGTEPGPDHTGGGSGDGADSDRGDNPGDDARRGDGTIGHDEDPDLGPGFDGWDDVWMGQPEGFGEVLDYPDPEKRDQGEAEARAGIMDALETAKACGSMPAGMERIIRGQMESRVNWQEKLAQYLDANSDADYSYQRPNRRYGGDFILPSLDGGALDEIIIAFDTSGSMSQRELEKGWAEIVALLSMAGQDEVTVLWCDSQVHEQVVSTAYEDLPVPVGGGGTDVVPVFEWVRKNYSGNPRLLIYVTDGGFIRWPAKPEYDVLWLLTCPSQCFEYHRSHGGWGDVAWLRD